MIADLRAEYFNAQEVQRIVSQVQQGGIDLAAAIQKGQAKCDGLAIAARGRVVQPSEYSRVLKVSENLLEGSDTTLVFEIACAPRDPQGRVEAVAVLPESGQTLPLRGIEHTFRTVAQRERNPYEDSESGEFREFDEDRGESGRHMKSRGLCKASKMLGAEVTNRDQEEIGEIEDLAIDTRTGRIRYVVLQPAPHIESDDDYFAIPLKAFSPGREGTAILNIPSEELEHAQGFDEDNWPQDADSRWARLAMKGHDPFSNRPRRFGMEEPMLSLASFKPAKARKIAKGLFENNFTLIDAVKYVEGRNDCQAIAACAKPDTEGFTGSDANVFVEVACHSRDEPNMLKLVCVSPRTGNIIRTRELALADAYGSR